MLTPDATAMGAFLYLPCGN